MKIADRIRIGLRTQNLQFILNENNGILKELNWANVFNNTIHDSKWLRNKSFSPGRSAVGYPLLYVIYRILDEVNPLRILEFGLGQSSKMLNQYANYYPGVQVTAIEHNSRWVDFFCSQNSLPQNASISLLEVENTKFNGYNTSVYKGLDLLIQDKVYDLILVDGPIGSERFSKTQILDLIPLHICKDHFCVIIDDFNRVGEKDTCNELEKVLAINNIEFHSGEYKGIKSSRLYASNDLEFLTTL